MRRQWGDAIFVVTHIGACRDCTRACRHGDGPLSNETHLSLAPSGVFISHSKGILMKAMQAW